MSWKSVGVNTRATPAAELAVSGEGYHCRDCAMVRARIMVAALPDPATLRPSRRRWLAGVAIGVVLVGVVVVALLVRRDRANAAALRAAYPEAAEPAQAVALAVRPSIGAVAARVCAKRCVASIRRPPLI